MENAMQINLNNRVIPLKDNAEDLKNWMYDCDVFDIDAVLEFLVDRELLNEQGERVAYKFWKMYIEEKE